MQLTKIGIVKNSINASMDPLKFQNIESVIEINEEFRDGLYRLDESRYVTIVFLMHKSTEPIRLKHFNRHGEYKGVFATRTPHRPNSLGISTVQLLETTEKGIQVMGLDAINGTPVIDIKPYFPLYDLKEENGPLDTSMLTFVPLDTPRSWIIEKILADDKTSLFHAAGQLHGHYCPGLALGIHLGTRGMQELRKFSNGIMENLIAIVEMNNCASDAIQFVTGCTFGNNSLIFEDIGKTAVTLVERSGKALRITVKDNWRDLLPNRDEYTQLFDKVVRDRNATEEEINAYRKTSRQVGFDMMNLNSNLLLNVEVISYDLPARAPIHSDFYCDKCREKAMSSRKIIKNDQEYCMKCAYEGYYRLTGHGIEFYHKENLKSG